MQLTGRGLFNLSINTPKLLYLSHCSRYFIFSCGFLFKLPDLHLNIVYDKKGDLQEARESILEALEAAQQSIDLYVIAYCTDDAALLAAQLLDPKIAGSKVTRERDLEKIARLLGAMDHWREIRSLPRTPRAHAAYLQITEMLRGQMEISNYSRVWQNG